MVLYLLYIYILRNYVTWCIVMQFSHTISSFIGNVFCGLGVQTWLLCTTGHDSHVTGVSMSFVLSNDESVVSTFT